MTSGFLRSSLVMDEMIAAWQQLKTDFAYFRVLNAGVGVESAADHVAIAGIGLVGDDPSGASCAPAEHDVGRAGVAVLGLDRATFGGGVRIR